MNGINQDIQNKKYPARRNIRVKSIASYKIRPYLLSILPKDKEVSILDK
jgi:hypothetical protein